MYNADTELIFPLRIGPSLGPLRGTAWQQLVDRVFAPDADPVDQKAFVLMMLRLGGCLTCNADSFRAMRGCTQCAERTIRRFRGSDRELIEQFNHCRQEMETYLESRVSLISEMIANKTKGSS